VQLFLLLFSCFSQSCLKGDESNEAQLTIEIKPGKDLTGGEQAPRTKATGTTTTEATSMEMMDPISNNSRGR
jgi:hypothetical protein